MTVSRALASNRGGITILPTIWHLVISNRLHFGYFQLLFLYFISKLWSPRSNLVTRSVLNGVPLETVSKMLGHSSIKSTQLYAKIMDEKIKTEMKTLRKKLKAG